MKATAVIKRPSEVKGVVGSPPSITANVSRLGGASVIVDPDLDPTSTNPVENKAIAEAIEDINGNLMSLDAAIDDLAEGKQNKIYYIVNGSSYPILRLLKVSAQGVSGVLLEYDDGTPTGSEVFFADGNGLNTVLNAVNASIATKQDALTFDSVPTENSTNPVTSGGVYSGLQYVMGELADNVTALSGQIDGKYDASNPNGYVNATQAANAAPVQSVNGQTGAVSLSIPTRTSDLTNNSGFITAAGAPVQSVNGATGNVTVTVPTKTSDLTNDSGFVNASGAASAAPVQSVNGQTGTVSLSIPTVPSNVSAFTNDAGYVTASTAPVRSVNGQTGVVTLSIPTVPTNVSAFTNDAGYLTLSTLPIYSGGVSP